MNDPHLPWTEHLLTQAYALAAGFLGSVISLRFMTTQSLAERVSFVLSGTLVAQFVSPLIAAQFELHAYQSSLSFLTGLFGMSFCSVIFTSLRELNLWHFLKERWGKR